MNVSVKLKRLIDEMDGQMDEYSTYFNTKTGDFVLVSDEAFRIAEEDEDEESTGFMDVEEDEVQLAVDILENPDDYIELPSKYDIHEYDIMERFCMSVENEKNRKILLIAIKGSGAFRRFKEMVRELGMEDQWYRFKDEAYREKAIEWCNENGLTFEE